MVYPPYHHQHPLYIIHSIFIYRAYLEIVALYFNDIHLVFYPISHSASIHVMAQISPFRSFSLIEHFSTKSTVTTHEWLNRPISDKYRQYFPGESTNKWCNSQISVILAFWQPIKILSNMTPVVQIWLNIIISSIHGLFPYFRWKQPFHAIIPLLV